MAEASSEEAESCIGILEIAHVLQQKILYMTGSTDKEGHPLIICDQFPSSHSYTDAEFRNATRFINYIAQELWKDVKCVIIVNRLTTKWSAVHKILKSLDDFNGLDIEHVLVLKPQGFLQKHFVNNETKQIQNSSKHKIILLEDATKLEEYIEKVDLPNEFGGCDFFNVTEWVEHSTAVENFRGNCRKVEDRLMKMKTHFGTTVSLTDSDEVEKRVKQNSQLVEDIENDIKCNFDIETTIAPIVDKSLKRKSSPLEEYTSSQLKLHSSFLEGLSNEVRALWNDQKISLDEVLKVCLFDEKYGTVAKDLIEITSLIQARADVGYSLSAVIALLEELDYLETKNKERYEVVLGLQEEILLMISDFSFYPIDNIRIRCNQVKKLGDDFDTALRNRRETLNTSLDVYKCLDQMENWCKVAVDLLASQPVEAFSRKEGAKDCLQELDKFMQQKQGINMKTMNRITSIASDLGDNAMIEMVAKNLARMEEVKGMLEKRETSLKKVGEKPPRPVQPVRAYIRKDLQQTATATISATMTTTAETVALTATTAPTFLTGMASHRRGTGSKTSDDERHMLPMSPGKVKTKPVPPEGKINKKDIEVRPNIVDERQQRNRLRKSMKLALKKPVSSVKAAQNVSQFEEDPVLKTKIVHVVTELIETENVYVNDLKSVIDGYYKAFDDPKYDIPDNIRRKKEMIFGNIGEIYNFHNEVFSKQLRTCNDEKINVPYQVGQVFLQHKQEFHLYAIYCKNKPKSELVRRELNTSSSFLEVYRNEIGHRLNLDSYLLKPVQRITKYQLLLHQILKYVSEKNPAHISITRAVQTMKRSLRYVNDVMHSSGLVGVPSWLNIDNQGELILQDTFNVREGRKGALMQLGSGPRQRQIFLFEQCIIISKKETEQIGEIGTYEFKDCLMTAKIGCTEVARGDELTFEIWTEEKDMLYYLRPETSETKENWLTEIRKILMLQLENEKKRRSHASPASPLMKLRGQDRFAVNSQGNLSPNIFPTVFNFDGFYSNRTSSEFEEECEDDFGWSDSEFEHESEEEEEKEGGGRGGGGGEAGEIDKLDEVYSEKNASSAKTTPLISVNTFEALADYSGVETSELSLCVGDLVNLLKEGDEGWWYCRALDRSGVGWVPSSYLHKPTVKTKEMPAINVETSV